MSPTFAILGLTWQWPWLLMLTPIYLLLISLAAFLHRRRFFRLARLGYYVPRALGLRSSSRGWLYSGLRWYSGLALLTVGIAGPIWGSNRSAEIAPERDLVLVVDLSRSMLANDVLPNRCQRACESIGALCDHLEKRGGVRLALVGFAGQGRVLCPLTRDYEHVRQLALSLDPASPPSGARPDQPGTDSGTRIGAGLQAAATAIDQETIGFTDVVLLSDGDDPAGDQEFKSGVSVMQALRVPIHTIGIGNPQANWDLELPIRRGGKAASQHVTTSLKEEPLREIAKTTGGVYVPARTLPCDLAGLYDEIIEPLPRAESVNGNVTQPPVHRAWFFTLGLVFLSAELVQFKRLLSKLWPWHVRPIGWRVSPGLAGVAALGLISLAPDYPEDAETYLQTAYRAFAAGKYHEAQTAFGHAKRLTNDPGFAALDEAISCLRLGQYEDGLACIRQALEDADPVRRSLALIVRGICLFHRAGEDVAMLRQAAGDFRDVLYAPGSEEALRALARHNLELTRMVLAEMTPPSGQNQKPGAENERPGGENDGNDAENRPGTKNGLANDASKQGQGGDQGDDQENLLSNPGKGNLPLTIGESGNALSTADALELLANAEKRIHAELIEQRRQRVLDINAPTKDW